MHILYIRNYIDLHFALYRLLDLNDYLSISYED